MYYEHSSFRKFSVFKDFSKHMKGEAESNPEFQKSMKELNEKFGVMKEEFNVRKKKTTEKLYKGVDGVWTEAEATSKKVCSNVKEKLSAAKEEVKETFGLGKQESLGSTCTPTSSSSAKDGSTKAKNSQNAEDNNRKELPGETDTLFGRVVSTLTSASSNSFRELKKLKGTKFSEFAKKGYNVLIDELNSNPTKKMRKHYASAPASSEVRSTITDIVVVPSKKSRIGEMWEAFKNKIQELPISKRINEISKPVVTKGQEVVEDVKERLETSDSPLVHKILDANDTIFGETATGEAIKEIWRREPSFSLPVFVEEVQEMVRPVLIAYSKGDVKTLEKYCAPEVIERCKGEKIGYESNDMFFDSKILHISEVDVREIKLIGSVPTMIVAFQTQEIFCIRDREGSVKDGGKDTIQTVMYGWAMQQVDTDDLGGACYPVWRLYQMEKFGVQALI